MPPGKKGKRGNEFGQMSKEDYESMQDRGEDGGQMPSGPFDRANNDTLKKRRILSVSKSKKWGVPGSAGKILPPQAATGIATTASISAKKIGTITTSASPGNGAPGDGSSNPFSSFTFGGSSSSTSSQAASAINNSNPFAKVQLASSSSQQQSSTAAIARKPTQTSNSSTNPSLTTAENYMKALIKLGTKSPRRDVNDNVVTYIDYAKYVFPPKNQKYIDSSNKENKSTATSSSVPEASPFLSSNVSTKTTTGKAPPASPFLGFGSGPNKAAAATTTTTTPSTDTTPKSTFSFSFNKPSTTTTTSPATQSSGFSFNVGKPSTPAAAPAAGSSTTTGFSFNPTGGNAATNKTAALSALVSNTADDDNGGENDDEPTKVEANPEESDYNTIHTVRVSYYKKQGKEMKKFLTGPIKLETHKENSSLHRMVMRNNIGKVLLNIGISKGMIFQEAKTPKKGGGNACQIMFKGIQDAEKGPELFKLAIKEENLDETLQKLKEMAS